MTHHIRPKAVFNWSGGKDSALALHQVLQEDRYEIVALLTTVNRSTRRSSMHGIPTELLQRQADSIGIPLYVVDLTGRSGHFVYGFRHIFTGNCFLRRVHAELFLQK